MEKATAKIAEHSKSEFAADRGALLKDLFDKLDPLLNGRVRLGQHVSQKGVEALQRSVVQATAGVHLVEASEGHDNPVANALLGVPSQYLQGPEHARVRRAAEQGVLFRE
ncbi:MAG TPA: hypothetical protein VEX38_08585 [Fimbriimonadaceae bacterium]|nr:hypothetical protein [Fimbriimonadaceae bacterium]